MLVVMSSKRRASRIAAGLALVATSVAASGCAEDLDRPAAYPAQQAVAEPPGEWAPEDGAPDGQGEPPSAMPADYDPALDHDPSALTDFRDVLAPYGAWVDDATYGTVWIPSTSVVGDDFAPYVTAGHWGMTDGGQWIWVSDYDWGWAPFHYGRWVWVGGRGWAWIPGRVYAPAWVVWRTGYYDDYYVGWAPMPPAWYWWGGVAVGISIAPRAPFVFCSSRYVFSPGLHRVVVPPARVGIVANATRPYVAASPGVRGGATFGMTRGPSIADAHIPAQAVPAHAAAHDTRALGFARPAPGARLVAPPATRPYAAARPGAVAPAPYRSGATVPRAQPYPGAPPRVAPGAPGTQPRFAPGSPAQPRVFPGGAQPHFAPQPRTFTPAPGPGPSHGFAPSPGSVHPVTPAPRPSFHPSAPVVRPAPTFRGGGGRHR